MLYYLFLLNLLLAASSAYPALPNDAVITEFCGKFNQCESLGDGCVTIFNGFQYKRVLEAKTWEESRTICGNWGGKLAVHGIQNMESRRLVFEALSILNTRTWIGLKRRISDDLWYWENGERAVPSAVLWGVNEPSSPVGVEDCAEVISSLEFGMGTNDISCTETKNALCEKEIL